MRFKKSNFRVPIYNWDVEIVLTDEVNEYSVSLDSKKTAMCPRAIILDYINTDKESDYHFIVIFDCEEVIDSDIVHESAHLAIRMLRYIGTPIVATTEEPFAYLQEYLFNKIKDKILRLKILLNTEEDHADQREETSKTDTRSTAMET